MLNIVLYQPEIPPNTGNIIRLCANTGCALHLVEPLGFDFDDKKLRRAGLDYREFAHVMRYPDLGHFLESHPHTRLLGATTRAKRSYHQLAYHEGDAIMFGPETRGLPEDVLASLGPERLLRLPMLPNSRSLNLSNATAVVVYEALRQLDYPGLS